MINNIYPFMIGFACYTCFVLGYFAGHIDKKQLPGDTWYSWGKVVFMCSLYTTWLLAVAILVVGFREVFPT